MHGIRRPFPLRVYYIWGSGQGSLLEVGICAGDDCDDVIVKGGMGVLVVLVVRVIVVVG